MTEVPTSTRVKPVLKEGCLAMRRFVGLLVAVTALAVTPVPTAKATHDTCDGLKTQITGTDTSEKFTLTKTKRVINAHGGNDIIEMGVPGLDFLDFPATVCMGSGNDILRSTGNGPEG